VKFSLPAWGWALCAAVILVVGVFLISSNRSRDPGAEAVSATAPASRQAQPEGAEVVHLTLPSEALDSVARVAAMVKDWCSRS